MKFEKEIKYFDCKYWERGCCTYLERSDLGNLADKLILRPLNIPPNLAVGDGEQKVCFATKGMGFKCNRRLRRKRG